VKLLSAPLKPTLLSHLVGLVDVDAPLSQLGPQDVLVAAKVDVLRTLQTDAAAREHRLYTTKTTLEKLYICEAY
jgi:hypothetical protein